MSHNISGKEFTKLVFFLKKQLMNEKKNPTCYYTTDSLIVL